MPDLFDITLTSSTVTAEPGDTAELEILVHNGCATADTAALEVEFGEPSWVALPVSSVSLAPGQSKTIRVVFKVPRASAAHAGHYPFVILARSIETGTAVSAQGTLNVHPYHAFTFSVNPGHAESRPFSPSVQYDLSVQNQGNRAESYELSVKSQEGECLYELPVERVEVGPGETVEIPLTAEPRRRPLIAPSAFHTFEARAEPLSRQAPGEAAHGQLRYRPLCHPITAVIVLALALFAGYWGYLQTQAPVITDFKATPDRAVAGDTIKLTYDVSRARKLVLRDETFSISYPLDPNSASRLVAPTQTTSYTLIAEDGAGHKVEQKLTVEIKAALPPPPPSISSLKANPPVVEYGHTTTLSWKVSNAQSLMLAPSGKTIDLALPDLEIPATELTDTKTFTLVAKNSIGAATKSITVKVIPPPNPTAPEVTMFAVTPASVRPGEPVTLSWNVQGASSVLISGIGAVDAQGSRTFQVERSTSFTLDALAPSGAKTTKIAKARVVSPSRIVSFDALPTSIQPGQSTRLTWKVVNADTVSIDAIGPVDPEGSQDVSPAQTTTYTLRAVDKAGHASAQTVTVTVGE